MHKNLSTAKRTLAAHKRKLLKKTQHKVKKNERILKPKKGRHSSNPTYLSGTYTEYKILRDDFGFFYIKPYGGGRVHSDLQGKWSSESEAERVLISWLETTDKRAQSRYPGCPPRRQTAYSEYYLKDTT